MGTEVEHTPNHAQTVVASPSSASASGSKTSMFTRKSGFVIPKNKLSGSMIPVFRGTKKGDTDSLNEDASGQIHRKTKWGPDLTRDPSVRKGRALAYQTRVNQISQQLTFGALEIEDNQDSLFTSEFKDGKTSHFPLKQEDTEFLESERREIIGELLKLTPGYKAPTDYKPLLKEATVPIHIKDYPGCNFIVAIFGPANETQKRMEKETGAKIRVYGSKADKEGKFEVTPTDRNEIEGAYEALYVHVSADTFEKIDAAVALIELLVTQASVNQLPASTSVTISGNIVTTGQNMPSSFVAPVLINQDMSQSYTGPLPQADSQGHPHTSFPAGIAQTSLFRGSGFLPSANPSAPLLSNPVQVSSSNMPSYFGPPPLVPASFSPVPQNSVVFSSSQPPHALQSLYRPQALLPGQACTIGNSPQGALPFTVELPSLESNAISSQNLVVSVTPQMNITNNVISPVPTPFQSSGAPFGHPVTAPSYNSASQLQRGVSPLRPSEPVPSAVHPLSVGPMRPVVPPSVAVRFSSPNILPGSIPIPLLGTSSPSIPQDQPHSYVSGSAAKFDSMKPISPLIPRPQHASSGDFTFQPHHPQSNNQVTWQSNQPPSHNLTPRILTGQAPPSPLIRPLLQNPSPSQVRGFPSPQASYQMNQPKPQIPMNLVGSPAARVPPTHLPLPGLNTIPSPAAQRMQQNYVAPYPTAKPAGPYPPRAPPQMNTMPQNPFPGPNLQGFMSPRPRFGVHPGKPFPSGGTQQVYDPFSPTSVPLNPQVDGNASKKQDGTDPEYDDLMASVGVK